MPEHQSDILVIFTATMEILLEPTSSKLLVGDVGDSIWIELVTLDINLGNNEKKPEKAVEVATAKGDSDGDVYLAIDTEKSRDKFIVDS
nr:retrovirus-related Pol polyprotein from transposon TNT 1-94 [Tanacetum cinerariifolium]